MRTVLSFEAGQSGHVFCLNELPEHFNEKADNENKGRNRADMKEQETAVSIFSGLKEIRPEQRTHRRVIMQQIDAKDAGGDAVDHGNPRLRKRRKEDDKAYGLHKDKR